MSPMPVPATAFNLSYSESHMRLRSLPRRSLLAAALSSCMAPVALAQTAAPATPNEGDVTAVGYVMVTGQVGQLNRALRKQEDSDRTESVAHANDIGQLPDENAAEALQRLSGVSVERDQGEGRFVTVRGMAPDMNAVTINGATLPAPESGRRAVAMDVLPSELIESLSVVKTLTPDMDANSLGATIEVETLSAFDRRKALRTVSVEANHNELVGKTSPKVSGAFTHRFGGPAGQEQFGIAVAASYQDRKLGSDNVENGGEWEWDDGELEGLNEFEQRDYVITRKRAGVGVNLDFRPNAGGKYYVRTVATKFDDHEDRDSAKYKFDDPMMPGDTGTIEAERELKSRDQNQNLRSIVLGGSQELGDWTVSGQFGSSYADEETTGIAGGVFEGEDDYDGFSYTGTKELIPQRPPEVDDYRNFELDEIEWEHSHHKDRMHTGRLDFAKHFDLEGGSNILKFGAKSTRRHKISDVDVWAVDDLGNLSTNLADYMTTKPIDFGMGSFGHHMDAGKLVGITQGLISDDNFDDEGSTIDDYIVDEDIDALYVMDKYERGNLRVIGGVRHERTKLGLEGTGIEDGDFVPVSLRKSYSHTLPNLQAIYRLADRTLLRGGFTQSVVRPTFSHISPSYEDDGEEAKFGNPDLKPLHATNLDFGIEHYAGEVGLLSAHAFYKRIKDFSYRTELAGTTGRWEDYDSAETYRNGDRATLSGIELGFSRQFAGNFLINANYTYTHSEADIERDGVTETVQLPNQSEQVGNLTLGWENDALSIRLAANYKSGYLYEMHATDATRDLFNDAQTFVDLSVKYRISPALQLAFQASNLTDVPYYTYQFRKQYNAQFEEYGRTYKLGLTWSF